MYSAVKSYEKLMKMAPAPKLPAIRAAWNASAKRPVPHNHRQCLNSERPKVESFLFSLPPLPPEEIHRSQGRFRSRGRPEPAKPTCAEEPTSRFQNQLSPSSPPTAAERYQARPRLPGRRSAGRRSESQAMRPHCKPPGDVFQPHDFEKQVEIAGSHSDQAEQSLEVLCLMYALMQPDHHSTG